MAPSFYPLCPSHHCLTLNLHPFLHISTIRKYRNYKTLHLTFLASSQTHEVQYPLKFEDKELKEKLSQQQYDVTQNKGTERYTGSSQY
jgi:hypothetical protein